MKKCRQCGLLSADTATVCRHCNFKFSEDDKPIIATPKKKKSIIFTIIFVVIAVAALTLFALYQTGMLKTWSQAAEKEKIISLAEEFVKADFERDEQKIRGYMFDSYIEYHEKLGTFSLQKDKYISFYFSLYSPDISINILSVNTDFLKDDFQLYSSEISRKYSVSPTEIVCAEVEVQITDSELNRSVIAPMTFVKVDKNWFIIPVI